MTSAVTIVVPVLNEIDVLADVQSHISDGDFEQIIIVDGGSTDGSWEWLQEHWHDGQQYLAMQAPAGRARQMNAGAKVAKGDVLVFLHADSHLPDNAKQLVSSIEHGPYWWGRFNVRFSSQFWLMRMIAWFMNQRSKLTAIATGDQAMFMRRIAYDQVGGFDQIALMEDIAMSQKLKKLSRPLCISKTVLTSARRWEENGVGRTVLSMWALRLAYFFGVSPDRLAQLYKHIR